MEEEVVITQAETEGNKYFIFRNSGEEITFIITEFATIKSEKKLLPFEVNYIRENILKVKEFF